MSRIFPAPIIGESAASGAQVIDGSLRFDSSKGQYLKQTFSANGNKKTFTYSFWAKKTLQSQSGGIIFSGDNNVDGNNFEFRDAADKLRVYSYQNNSAVDYRTTAEYRDTSGWKHFVVSIDSTNGTASDRMKLYVNGERVTSFSTASGTWGSNTDYKVNTSGENHYIGLLLNSSGAQSTWFDGQMSQWYFIDGQALGPEYFGYTDGLTNTWKPKKYEGTFGTNGFWLPMDGNSPIGQDQSGQGNDWTPINFGGSVALDSSLVSGARPILNTTQGGTTAGVGVFGSLENKYYTVTTANGSVYQFDITSGDNPSLEFIRGATYRFDYTSHASHPLRFSSTNPDSSTTAYTTGTNTSVSNVITITVPHDAPDTLYYYCTAHASAMNGAISVTTDNTKADQYAANCVLALPLVGSKEDVSVSIACTSSAKSISSNGSPAASGAQSNFYGKSFQFIETDSDRLDCTIAALGTRDFTLEFWFYTSSTTGYQTLAEYGDHTSNGFYLSVRDGVAIMARSSVGDDIANAGGGTPGSLPSGSLINTPTNKYHHIALTRESNTAKLFQNGKYIGSGTWDTNYTPTNLRLAHSIYGAGSAEYLTGFMQDVRLYDGVVKYTGTTVNEQSFVVPSTNPNLLPDTPSGVSGSLKSPRLLMVLCILMVLMIN